MSTTPSIKYIKGASTAETTTGETYSYKTSTVINASSQTDASSAVEYTNTSSSTDNSSSSKTGHRKTKSVYTTEVYCNNDGKLTIIIRDPRTPKHTIIPKEDGAFIEYDDPKGIIVKTYYGSYINIDMNLSYERAQEYRESRTRIISKGMKAYKEYDHKEPYFFIVWGKMILVLVDHDILSEEEEFKTFREIPEFLYESIWTIQTAMGSTQCEIVFTTSHPDEGTDPAKLEYDRKLFEKLNEIKEYVTDEEMEQIIAATNTAEMGDDAELHNTLVSDKSKPYTTREKLKTLFDELESLMMVETMRISAKGTGSISSASYLSAIVQPLTAPFYTSPKINS